MYGLSLHNVSFKETLPTPPTPQKKKSIRRPYPPLAQIHTTFGFSFLYFLFSLFFIIMLYFDLEKEKHYYASNSS